MIIPYNQLSSEALQALIEDFVTRDGTDYGMDELGMLEKSENLLELLKSGKLLINYNEETQSCGIMRSEDYESG